MSRHALQTKPQPASCPTCGSEVPITPEPTVGDLIDTSPEAMVKKAYTERGFRLYLYEPDGGCQGAAVTVVESSLAFEGAHVRIYHGDDHVHLHVDVAESVALSLLEFVAEARATALTEPVYRDDGGHGHEPGVFYSTESRRADRG